MVENKKYISLLIVIFFWGEEIYATESLDSTMELSQNVINVLNNTNPIYKTKTQFELSTEDSDAVLGITELNLSHIEVQKKINDGKKDCKEISDKPDSYIKVKGLIGLNLFESSNPNLEFQILKKYNNYLFVKQSNFESPITPPIFSKPFSNSSVGSDGISGVGPIDLNQEVLTMDDLISKYKIQHPGEEFDKIDPKTKLDKISSFANKYLNQQVPANIIAKELLLRDLVLNSKDWKKSIFAMKDQLGTQDKIDVVSKLGSLMSDKYNYERFNQKWSAKGSISINELLESIKNGTVGGVCRDIALAQTQILNELGFKDNYTVSYKTLDGYHTVAISKDPSTGKVIKFNYGEATAFDENSSMSNIVNTNSTLKGYGLNFRIHDSNGKPVTSLPTELSKAMMEVTGAEQNIFFRPQMSIGKAEVQVGNTNANLFYGKTSSGDTIYGISVYGKKDEELYSLKGAVALSNLKGEQHLSTFNQKSLYLRAGVEIRTPSIGNENINSHLFVGAEVKGIAFTGSESSNNSTKTSSKIQFDAMGEVDIGMKTKIAPNDSITINNKSYIKFYPDAKMISDTSKLTLAVDSIRSETSVENKISSTESIVVNTIILLKNYGASVGSEAIYTNSSQNIKAKIGGTTPLSTDVPVNFEGGAKTIYASFEKESTKDLVYSIIFERNINSKLNKINAKVTKKF